MRKKAKIQIELQSDLCVASGYSYDGVIDTDICYDALGIPYIPAKRLKGCFKETAESVLYSVFTEEDMKAIFGEWGQKFVTKTIIDNAYIQNYEQIKEELKSFIENQEKMKKEAKTLDENTNDLYTINPQKILEQFTHIQAQTAIGYIEDNKTNGTIYDGSAKDNSLRYTRVVNQYSPIDGNSLVFEAEIQYEAKFEDKIEMLLKGTRNIGLKRNRGFGSVKCSLNDIAEIHNTILPDIGSNTDIVCIDYVLTNMEPLVLSDKNDQKTMDYIKGQTMIGALASKYLQYEGHSADDEAFKDLFLNGNTIVTDAMPYKNGRTYYPAPLFINRLKKTKKIVNSIFVDKEETKGGNLPKKLKGKYVYATSDFEKADILEVDKQICYHHSHKSTRKSDESDILFAFEVVSENQEFAGKIFLPRKYEKLVKELLTSDYLNIGKSKSSQYGNCQAKIESSDTHNIKKRKFSKGDIVCITLQSDMLIHNGIDYTVFYDDVHEMIAKELGISYEPEFEEDGKTKKDDYSIVSIKEITGYLSVWNMRKTPVPAVAAGSMFSYKLKEDFQMSKEFCGERCLEGFGNVRIDLLKEKKESISGIGGGIDNPNDTDAEIKVNITKPLFSKIFSHDMEIELILKGIESGKFGLNQSKIGRVTLMLKESLDENRNDYFKAFKAFRTRVASIKSEDERKIIEDMVVNKIFLENDGEKILNVETEKLSLWSRMKDVGFSEEECVKILNSLWGRYVLMILINQKYENKK